ncbi:hypothetical protein LTSEWAN_5025, partial [Salmonella enterica subsp. enterica serovar Wandsworth str. A4-580]
AICWKNWPLRGRGAVREVCDLLLLAQGKLDEAKGQSI